MSLPAVNLNELDGQLGALPPTSGRLAAFVGVAAGGTVDVPATYGKVKDLAAALIRGPLLEDAACYIERTGKPCVVVRTGQSIAGSYLNEVEEEDGTISAITKTGTGSATFSNNASDPTVAANVKVLFVVGGTRGTAGIVYQISLDNGATWGPPIALGTAITFAVGATGASIAVSAGTIDAGDFISFTLTAPIPASAGEVTVNFDGSSVPTIDENSEPDDDYEVYIEFVKGGTRGTAGITYKWSLDGGRTMSAETALGTATSITIPDSGGVKVDLGAGTIVAGDNLAFPTVAPKWNNTELGTAMDALGNSVVNWEGVQVVGPIDADSFDVMETKIAALTAKGKNHYWMGSTRLPVGAETDATYTASLSAAFASKATKHGALCAGACEFASAVSSRKYRRPLLFPAGALQMNVSEQINIADVNVGLLTGVSLYDAAGNPKHHDEANNPGLDDARFMVARTWVGRQGIYVNLPRIFSAAGSDFELIPHRRVMNIVKDALQAYFLVRLNGDILVDGTSGFILETEALDIEAGAIAAMAAVLNTIPKKASKWTFVLSRTDNLLSTKTMTGQAKVVPLAYPRFINLDVGFENPALNVVQAV
jgi:hypothetical protein